MNPRTRIPIPALVAIAGVLSAMSSTARVLDPVERSSLEPTIELTSPVPGEIIEFSNTPYPDTVYATATVTGVIGTPSVQFVVNGVPLGPPVDHPPYRAPFTVGTRQIVEGPNWFQATMTIDGEIISSDIVNCDIYFKFLIGVRDGREQERGRTMQLR